MYSVSTVLAAGALAAGLMLTGTPTAHAGPLCPPNMPGMTPAKLQQCLNMENNQNTCGVAAGCPQGPEGGPIWDECREASKWTGIPCN